MTAGETKAGENLQFRTETNEGATVINIITHNITKLVNNAENANMNITGNQGRTPVIEGALDERLFRLEVEKAVLQ